MKSEGRIVKIICFVIFEKIDELNELCFTSHDISVETLIKTSRDVIGVDMSTLNSLPVLLRLTFSWFLAVMTNQNLLIDCCSNGLRSQNDSFGWYRVFRH